MTGVTGGSDTARSPAPHEPTARQLLAYAAPALPLAALSLPFYVMIPEFYARDLGLSISMVGYVLLLVRLLDAISDPIAGVLADGFRPTFGRRRLWVAVSAPLVVIAAVFVLMPPANPSALYLLFWASCLSLAWTAAQVPYGAWGAELSRSYDGRTRVAAFRETATVTGTLLALLLPAIIQLQGGDTRAGLAAVAILIAVGLPLGALLAVRVTPEPVERRTARVSLRDGLRQIWFNRPFRRLLLAFFINSLANGLPASLFLFFVADRLGAKDTAGPLLVLYFICGVAGVPFWLWLARRTSKHRAWALGMILAAVTFSGAAFLTQGQVGAFALVCVLTGLALGADVVLPASIQADVIELDTATNGAERAGQYLGFWALATKMAFAGAVGFAFPILGLAGFDPGTGLRSDQGLLMLALLYAGLPSLLKLGAVALIWSFPLDRAEALRIGAALGPARL
jgi:Na+/melibiose symporter-like transporter